MKILLRKHIYTPINSSNERSTVIVLFIIKIKDVKKSRKRGETNNRRADFTPRIYDMCDKSRET